MVNTATLPKVCVITGASRGLGRAFADHFLLQGYVVAGCSRANSTIDHPMYSHSSVDLRNESEVQKWAKEVRRSFKRVDVLICSAGLARSTMLLSLTPGDVFDDVLETNLSGVFYAMREFSKLMLKQGSGRILAISSTMAALHHEGTSCYSATKAGVTEMTKVLARELAPQGITCNVIAPAMMKTDSSSELSKSATWKKEMLTIQTFPRIIEMDEVCHVVDFFVSEKAASITGQVIYIGLVD